MERKIGEIFEYNGEWYQCLVSLDGCRECSFRAQYYCTRHTECFSNVRSDGISVIFKKLEKVGEPYEFDGHLFQSYRTFEVPIFTENYATVRELGNNSKISIEIKQNKEDMGEKKLNLKPFDIQKAREGKPVCTRDGRKARIICFDAKGDKPIIALIEAKGNHDALIEKVEKYFINGHSVFEVRETDDDLIMLPERKEGWAKVRKDINLYDTKEEADRKMIGNDEYVTAKVCWEE